MRNKVKLLILIGQSSDQIANQLQDTVEIARAKSMQDAVKLAQEYSHPGDAVLLSPGCASFDMFDNFEHRWQIFKEAFQKLDPIKDKTKPLVRKYSK